MTLIYGHRGAKGEAPENTLTSFQECLKHGVRRCELDLHLSMDGELMVIHDPTLKRTTDRRGNNPMGGRNDALKKLAWRLAQSNIASMRCSMMRDRSRQPLSASCSIGACRQARNAA